MSTDHTQYFLDLCLGEGTDHRGRTVNQIVQKPDLWLERAHDYIQWRFPLYR
jgi:hypothetical protein